MYCGIVMLLAWCIDTPAPCIIPSLTYTYFTMYTYVNCKCTCNVRKVCTHTYIGTYLCAHYYDISSCIYTQVNSYRHVHILHYCWGMLSCQAWLWSTVLLRMAALWMLIELKWTSIISCKKYKEIMWDTQGWWCKGACYMYIRTLER